VPPLPGEGSRIERGGSRDFRRLFAAHTISRWGDTFNAVALVIVVFQLTGSGLRVAGTVALEIAPVLLLGFFAGAFVDRHPRRRVMIAADLGRAAVAIGLAAFGDSLAVRAWPGSPMKPDPRRRDEPVSGGTARRVNQAGDVPAS
jgi:MFS family permease